MTPAISKSCPRCGLRVTGGNLDLCPGCLLREDPDVAGGNLPTAPEGIVLETLIGIGGMGRVFKGRHVRLDRAVAVKFLPPDLSADPGFEARFEREARLLAQLSHPNIVGVYDSGVTPDGDSYLVMEFVPGGTLADRGRVSSVDALAIGIDLCAGLQFAHEKGMVHRDIKPENILFDQTGRALIADFGIARMSSNATPAGDATLTRPTMVLGTPAFIPPEAYAGAPPNPRFDVFALGVLLHQAIVGRLPVGGIVSPDLPSALAPVLASAVAIDPAMRPASARELGQALLKAQSRLAVSERTTDFPADEQSWQSAVALVGAGATALALYAFLVSFTPRILQLGETLPLVSFGNRPLPDGRIYSSARFEIFPTLTAAAAFALAFALYGWLRRHWRHADLERPEPERRLTSVRGTLWLALFLNALFVLRIFVERTPLRAIATYTPVVGGVSELYLVYRVWNAFLEARRIHRPLTREPVLWLALALGLIPPVFSFVRGLLGYPV